MKTIKSIEQIDSFHQDTIHDISFDWYGKKIATCSSDHKVKIWVRNSDDKWVAEGELPAPHNAPIWKVKWAHPDYGTVLATCSLDKTVKIWEQTKEYIVSEKEKDSKPVQAISWMMRGSISEGNENIEDIKFAPKHKLLEGMTLCTVSSKGNLRIYTFETPACWQITSKILVNKAGLNAVSWNKNQFTPPILAVGCKDEITEKIQQENSKIEEEKIGPQEVVNGYIGLYALKGSSCELIKNFPGKDSKFHKKAVYDVSFSLLNGRSYDLLSSCGKEGLVVWYLDYDSTTNSMKVLNVIELDVGKAVYWKVCWNIMGTILASSNESNQITLWKNIGDDYFKQVGLITDDGKEEKKTQ